MKKLIILLGFLCMPLLAQDPPQVLCYIEGAQVTLTAVPGEGHVFGGWTGDIESMDNPVTFQISQDMEVTAHFFRAFRLTINVEGAGSVTADPPGIDN